MIKARAIKLKEAQDFVEAHYRHHMPVHRDMYRVGAEIDGELVGVIQVARPVSRVMDDGKTLEVVRLCTLGDKDVCSFLYSRAARIAKELGYSHIITYILGSESGISLAASGWQKEADTEGGRTWNTPARERDYSELQMTIFVPERYKYPKESKQRWGRILDDR